MTNGKSDGGGEQLAVGRGQWLAVGSGRWAVGGGQLAVWRVER